MDLVDWDEEVFAQIVREFRPLVEELMVESFQPLAVSALSDDNITEPSPATPWYSGPTLLSCLEDVDVTPGASELKFPMAVQYVNRPNHEFRGYCGRIASGKMKVGDRMRVTPGGIETSIRSIVAWQAKLSTTSARGSITLCFQDELDVTRGSVIALATDPAGMSDQFGARLLCLSEHPLVSGRSYLINLHTCQAVPMIKAIKHQVDVKTGNHLTARSLGMNGIGVLNLSTDRPVPFEQYDRCRRLGSFILVDRLTNQTVGAGMVDFSLRRAANIHWEAEDIDNSTRARKELQKPVCLWFTGLSASGKSTIANLLEKQLFTGGKHTCMLDGDNVPHGFNRDLGFSETDRVENIRRVTEVARLLVDAGLMVLVSFISPYRAERELARARFEPDEFIEVFVDTPIEECERRDPKGLYAKARRGESVNFTGIDSSYEPPVSPEIRLDTVNESVHQYVDRFLDALEYGLGGNS